LLAGLYHQAQLDEKANRSADAAILMEIAARRFPSDEAVQVLAAESLLVDRHDPAAALAALRKVTVPTEEQRWRFRHGWLTVDALDALGQTDAARTTLQDLLAEFPDSERVRRRLKQMGSNAK
jgi:predicted Zn-dependent protease